MKKVWIILPKIDGQDKRKDIAFFLSFHFLKFMIVSQIFLRPKKKSTALGRGEERVRYMERVTWKSALPYIKWTAKGNLLYGSGNSNRGSEST